MWLFCTSGDCDRVIKEIISKDVFRDTLRLNII